jgi:hypothetical protein
MRLAAQQTAAQPTEGATLWMVISVRPTAVARAVTAAAAVTDVASAAAA